MKLNRQTLPLNKPTAFDEDVEFSAYEFDPNYIRGINNCHVELTATQYEDILRIDIHIKANVIAICAYTLEDVDLPINVKDEIDFTDDENDDTCYYAPETIIDLDDYILSLILSAVPPKVVKKGAKLPDGGEGYRVLSEEELAKERANKKDSRWDALDDLDLESDK